VPVSDVDLVARVLVRDDRHAFAQIVRGNQAKVRALLRRLTAGDQARADDLAQETFLRAYRGLRGYAGKARLSTWLCQIAYHAFLADAGRAGQGKSDARGEDDGPGDDRAEGGAHDDAGSRAILRHDLERALGTLAPAERDALALTFGQDMTHEEAAQIVGCPLGTLKTNVARGLDKLERRMREWRPA
jgi:RNA polymerase sigma factor (sigma-70 family)